MRRFFITLLVVSMPYVAGPGLLATSQAAEPAPEPAPAPAAEPASPSAPAPAADVPEAKEDALSAELRRSWALLDAGDLVATVSYIDSVLETLRPGAVAQAKELKGFAAEGKELEKQAMNVAGTLSYIKALAYQKGGKRTEWLAALQTVWTDFPFCQVWDPKGWFWKPDQAAKKEGYMEEIRAAVQARSLTKSPFPETEDVLDYPQMSIALAAVTSRTMEEGDYAGLEHLAGQLQKLKLRYPDGDWMLPGFFTAAGGAAGPQKETASWDLTAKRLDAWQKAHPESVLPRIADAHRLIQYGWHVRGSGFADTVKEEAWPVFQEKLRAARNVLDRCPRTCPQWYVERLTVAFALSAPLKEQKALFEEGWKAFPDYLPLLKTMITSLLPRWSGQPGDAMRFARQIAKSSGAAAYTRVVNEIWDCDRETLLSDKNYDAGLYHKGWSEIQRERPGSLILAHRCLVIAISLGDIPLAKDAFKLAGERYHPQFWNAPSDYLEYRRRALGLKE